MIIDTDTSPPPTQTTAADRCHSKKKGSIPWRCNLTMKKTGHEAEDPRHFLSPASAPGTHCKWSRGIVKLTSVSFRTWPEYSAMLLPRGAWSRCHYQLLSVPTKIIADQLFKDMTIGWCRWNLNIRLRTVELQLRFVSKHFVAIKRWK